MKSVNKAVKAYVFCLLRTINTIVIALNAYDLKRPWMQGSSERIFNTSRAKAFEHLNTLL